jgi:hypothetical protein
MRRVRKFLSLSVREKFLLVEAITLVSAVRVGLTLLPFSTLQKLLAKVTMNHIDLERKRRFSIDQLAWSVATASHCVPKATCLVQALAIQVLLLHEGYPADLQIGVTKGDRGELQAHAWVESQGKMINSGSEIGIYKPLNFQQNGG